MEVGKKEKLGKFIFEQTGILVGGSWSHSNPKIQCLGGGSQQKQYRKGGQGVDCRTNWIIKKERSLSPNETRKSKARLGAEAQVNRTA